MTPATPPRLGALVYSNGRDPLTKMLLSPSQRGLYIKGRVELPPRVSVMMWTRVLPSVPSMSPSSAVSSSQAVAGPRASASSSNEPMLREEPARSPARSPAQSADRKRRRMGRSFAFTSIVGHDDQHFDETGEHWLTVKWCTGRPTSHNVEELFADYDEPMTAPAVQAYHKRRPIRGYCAESK